MNLQLFADTQADPPAEDEAKKQFGYDSGSPSRERKHYRQRVHAAFAGIAPGIESDTPRLKNVCTLRRLRVHIFSIFS